MIQYYFTILAIPFALLFMLGGSIIAFKAKRTIATTGMLVGILGEIVGYILQNFTTQEISYTGEGNAIIYHSPLMSVGMYLGQFCVLLAAISFFAFIKGLRNET